MPNTYGIPQAWTAVILGYVSGRSLNTGFFANHEYWAGKMLEQYGAYRPFGELDAAISKTTSRELSATTEATS